MKKSVISSVSIQTVEEWIAENADKVVTLQGKKSSISGRTGVADEDMKIPVTRLFLQNYQMKD